MAGLAQKGGAVYCHVKIGRAPGDVHAIRIAAGEADLMLGCDLVVAGAKQVLAGVEQGKTAVLVNSAEVFPGDIERNPDFVLPAHEIKQAIRRAGGPELTFIDVTGMAQGAFGRFYRRQYFHPRLRLAEGLSAAFGRGDPARHRIERRIRGDEPFGLSVGPPRRA